MLRLHVRRRLSEQLDGITHGPQGSLDKLLMTWVEQSVGHAALATVGTCDPELFGAYMYSRAQSVMGGTSQIQKNIIAHADPWIGETEMYDMPDEIDVQADGGLRIITLNRPDELNAVNDALHVGLAKIWEALNEDVDARAAVITGAGRAFSAGGDFNYLDELRNDEALRAEDDQARPRPRHRHGALPHPGGRRGQRSGRRAGLQPGGALVTSSTWPRPRSSPTRTCRSVWWPRTAARWSGRRRSACCRPRSSRSPACGSRPQRALELGMANHVVADPLAEAIACAKKIMELPQQAVEATKRLMNIQLEKSVMASLDYANLAEYVSFGTADFNKIVDGLIAKQKS